LDVAEDPPGQQPVGLLEEVHLPRSRSRPDPFCLIRIHASAILSGARRALRANRSGIGSSPRQIEGDGGMGTTRRRFLRDGAALAGIGALGSAGALRALASPATAAAAQGSAFGLGFTSLEQETRIPRLA